jgi:hypothetical protein
VSYPRHPKSGQIERMLREMQPTKMICQQLRVGGSEVRGQTKRLGMLRVLLTLEERLKIADARGIDRRLVP